MQVIIRSKTLVSSIFLPVRRGLTFVCGSSETEGGTGSRILAGACSCGGRIDVGTGTGRGGMGRVWPIGSLIKSRRKRFLKSSSMTNKITYWPLKPQAALTADLGSASDAGPAVNLNFQCASRKTYDT